MIAKKRITIILPCRNEEKAIQQVIKRLPQVVDEVIVVDNLSSDNTVKVAKKLGAKVFIEERSEGGIGYGFALATGIKNATGDIIICMDGDGSYPPEEIPSIIKYFNKNKLDFISCNRLPFEDKKDMSLVRMFGVGILNLFANILYGYPIKDSLSGMWVFTKQASKSLSLYEGGWNLSLEIKLQAITQNKIKFDEYHIPYKDRQFDQSKQNLFKTGMTHLLFLFTNKLPKRILLTVSKASLLEV